MTSAEALGDIEDVSAFLAFGVRAKLIPSRSDAYLRLVRRYIADSEFAVRVRAAAGGWGLSVLDVSLRSGLVLAAQPGSLFETKMDDYVRMASRDNRDREKVLHGIVHLAAAALCFPRRRVAQSTSATILAMTPTMNTNRCKSALKSV